MRLQPRTSFDIDQGVRTPNTSSDGISPQPISLILLMCVIKKCAAKLVDLDQGIRMANPHSVHNGALDMNAQWMRS